MQQSRKVRTSALADPADLLSSTAGHSKIAENRLCQASCLSQGSLGQRDECKGSAWRTLHLY